MFKYNATWQSGLTEGANIPVESTNSVWLFDKPWICCACGEVHQGVFDLGCFRPDYWQGSADYQPNQVALESNHFLSEDFCVLEGTHYFIRCVLEIPIVGYPSQRFGYGVWSSLSLKSYQQYSSIFDTGEIDSVISWFGWLSNRLQGYPDTLNLKCRVHPRAGRQRPTIELEPIDHPLVKESIEGITPERLMGIYKEFGHEFNPTV